MLAEHLDRVSGPRVAPEISWWWDDIAAGRSVSTMDQQDMRGPDVSVIVSVDQMRHNRVALLSHVHKLGPTGRVVFSEVASFEGRNGSIADFDVTTAIWDGGLSVIDVDRVPVSTSSGTWHIVGGIARITPEMPLVKGQQANGA